VTDQLAEQSQIGTQPPGPATARALAHLRQALLPPLLACGEAERQALLAGLAGGRIAAGPSGAPPAAVPTCCPPAATSTASICAACRRRPPGTWDAAAPICCCSSISRRRARTCAPWPFPCGVPPPCATGVRTSARPWP
jgi:hypothetical protein